MLKRLKDWAKDGLNSAFDVRSQLRVIEKEAAQKGGVGFGRISLFKVSMPLALIASPFPLKKLGELVDQLDAQQDSRKPNMSFQHSTVGNIDHSFLLTMDGKENRRAIEIRKQDIMKKFNRENIFNLTKIALEKLAKNPEIGERDILRLVLEVLAKVLFNVDTLPSNAAEVVSHASQLANNPVYMLAPSAISWLPFYFSRRAYQKLIQQIKRLNPQAEIANDSLFSVLVAADTLAKNINLAFNHLYKRSGNVEVLCSLIQRDYGQNDLTIDVLGNKELQAFYLEILRTSNGAILRRTSGLPELGIPAGTLVIFNLPSFNNDPDFHQNPYRFDPARYTKRNEKSEQLALSIGRRVCPAQGIAAPVILKTCIAFVAQRRLEYLISNNSYVISTMRNDVKDVAPSSITKDEAVQSYKLCSIPFENGTIVGGYSRPPEFFANPTEYKRYNVSEDCLFISINIGVNRIPKTITIGLNDREIFNELKENVELAKIIVNELDNVDLIQLQVTDVNGMINELQEESKRNAKDPLPVIQYSNQKGQDLFQRQLIIALPRNSKQILEVTNEISKRLAALGISPTCPSESETSVNDYMSIRKGLEKILIKDEKITTTPPAMPLLVESKVPNLTCERTFDIFTTLNALIEKTSKEMKGISNYTDSLTHLSYALDELYQTTNISERESNWFSNNQHLEEDDDGILNFSPEAKERNESKMSNFEKLDFIIKLFFRHISFHGSLAKDHSLPKALHDLCRELKQFLQDFSGENEGVYFSRFINRTSPRDAAFLRLQQYNENLQNNNVKAADTPPSFSWGSRMHRHIM